jgi:type VI protein secretion system component VasK
MQMTNTTDKLRRLAEVELLRAEVEARSIARRALCIVIAVFISILALTALSYGGFLMLATYVGTINAAFITSGALFVLAAIALAIAWQKPGRAKQLEEKILARSIQDARDDLREDINVLDHRFDQISGGLAQFLSGTKDGGQMNSNSLSANLAALKAILTAVAAASPALNRYIQPILKIIS